MSKNSPNNTTDLLERPKTHSEETPEHTIRCAHCAHTITTSHQRIEVEGKHVHNFMNPEGYRAAATADSFAKMTAWLAKNL